jgi:hypothetical protein
VATQPKGARIAVPLRKFRSTLADKRAAVDMAAIWEHSKTRQEISALQMFCKPCPA